MKSVAVIGGGITGLTAAFRLKQSGVPVTLYEAGDRAGGVIRSVRDGSWLVECGPSTLLETSPKISALVRDAGLESQKRYSDPLADKNFILRDGKLCAVPRSAPGFFTTPLFSLAAKMRLMREPFIRRAPADAEETLADFVRRRIGGEFLDYAINPFVGGIYAGDAERLSVRHGFPKLHAVEQKYGSLIVGQFLGARERKRSGETPKTAAKKFSFDDGLSTLTDRLAEKLGDVLKLRAPVAEVRREENVWRVSVGGEQHEHSAVLFTAPAHKLASVAFENPHGLSLAPLGEILHPSVVVVALGFRRDDVAHPLDGFGFLVPQKENRNILGTTFASTLFAKRAPIGNVLLTSYLGGCRSPELAARDSEALAELTLADLRAILGVRARPVFSRVEIVRNAIPQYNTGYSRFKNLMSDIENKMPGAFFAGSFRDGISLANSIVAGDDAAARIADFVAEKISKP
jgi:protoporphyrinogen/coproporphyrinogen III oxidase